jgi:hypothetical protein
MSPVMAAFRAFVCTVLILGIGGAQAHADRRPVAVVDLASELPTRELGEQLKAALDVHGELRTLPSSTDEAALIDKLDDPDVDRITRARAAKAKAEAQILGFDFKAAITDARDGQSELLYVTPSRATAVYADLAFVLGKALHNDQRLAEAKIAFAHAHRLDPSRTLDPTRVVPDIVQAYADAKAAPVLQGTIEVPGTGNVWIDGTEVGLAPGTFPASEGEHVVWRTGIDRETRGLRVAVTAAKPIVAEIPDFEAPRRTKVQRARQLLARAPDPSARSAAMQRLADLVGVKDAVLLSMSGGRVIVQTWHDGPPGDLPRGFSALRERGTAKVDELLTPLAPPKKPIEPPFEGPIKGPVVVEKSFFERRPVQLGFAVGIAAAIVAAVLWATRDPGSQPWDPNIGVDNPGIGR